VSPGGIYSNDTAFVSVVKPNAVVQDRSASVPKAARKNETFRALFTMEWLQLRSASEGGPYKIAIWRRFGLMKVSVSEGLGRDWGDKLFILSALQGASWAYSVELRDRGAEGRLSARFAGGLTGKG